ncbi:hypothetical protein ACFX1R_033822 [Malus domestica]
MQFLQRNPIGGIVGRTSMAFVASTTIVPTPTTFVATMKTMFERISMQFVACVNGMVGGVTISAVELFTGRGAAASLAASLRLVPLTNSHY